MKAGGMVLLHMEVPDTDRGGRCGVVLIYAAVPRVTVWPRAWRLARS